MNQNRFEGILTAHIDLLRSLSAYNKQEQEKTNDAFQEGLKQGMANAFDLCAEWLEETLRKEVSTICTP